MTETMNATATEAEQAAVPEYLYQDGWLELDGMRFHYTEWGAA